MPKRTVRTQKESPDKKSKPQLCKVPKIEPRALPVGVSSFRQRLIRVNEKKWANGTRLRYYFFDRPTDGENGNWVGPTSQKDAVRQAFQEWKDLGIGLEFSEVSNREEAEVRVGFLQTDGSWSYLGRDVIGGAGDPNERTMNFGWDLTTPYGRDTALHEIGHTLGFPHEHQNPNSGIEWNESAVLEYFRGYPNYWSDDDIRWNILRKISPEAVTGSGWDPNSIMHYAFEAGLIREPAKYAAGLEPDLGLSETDIEEVRSFYPSLETAEEPELRPFESRRLMIGAGEQVNFVIRPEYSRRYTIQTFGRMDTVMVLFERVGDETWYVAGDDDSGYDRNAHLRARLHRGREYILRIRLYYSAMSGQAAVFMY